MSPVYRIRPLACALHAAGLLGMILLGHWLELPSLPVAIAVLVVALLPWLGAWRGVVQTTQGDSDATQDFKSLSKTLSRHTCHNALSAARVSFSAERLAERFHSQLAAVSEIANGAEAMAITEQDSADRARHALEAAEAVRRCSMPSSACSTSVPRPRPAVS